MQYYRRGFGLATPLELKLCIRRCDYCGNAKCSNYIVYERTEQPEVLYWCGNCKADQQAEYIGRTFI